MKKILTSLPFRLIVALLIGIGLGQVFGEGAMKVVVSLQYVLGQLIMFCVPLIVIGFIAPSITRMGSNASRMLSIAVIIAYLSSICAAFMSTAAGFVLIPHLSIVTDVRGRLSAQHPADHVRHERVGLLPADRSGRRMDEEQAYLRSA